EQRRVSRDSRERVRQPVHRHDLPVRQSEGDETQIRKQITMIKRLRFGRRSFIKLLSALGVATASKSVPAQTATPSPSPSPSPSPTPAPRITKEMMHEAEKLMGIELTDAQEAMALGGVNRNLDSYETVRKIDVPLDTEPAIAFHPVRGKKDLYGQRTKFRFG